MINEACTGAERPARVSKTCPVRLVTVLHVTIGSSSCPKLGSFGGPAVGHCKVSLSASSITRCFPALREVSKTSGASMSAPAWKGMHLHTTCLQFALDASQPFDGQKVQACCLLCAYWAYDEHVLQVFLTGQYKTSHLQMLLLPKKLPQMSKNGVDIAPLQVTEAHICLHINCTDCVTVTGLGKHSCCAL